MCVKNLSQASALLSLLPGTQAMPLKRYTSTAWEDEEKQINKLPSGVNLLKLQLGVLTLVMVVLGTMCW